MFCQKCGSEEFANKAGVECLIRTCRVCGESWSSKFDALHQEAPQPEVSVDVEDLPVKEEAPVKKRPGRRKAPTKGDE